MPDPLPLWNKSFTPSAFRKGRVFVSAYHGRFRAAVPMNPIYGIALRHQLSHHNPRGRSAQEGFLISHASLPEYLPIDMGALQRKYAVSWSNLCRTRSIENPRSLSPRRKRPAHPGQRNASEMNSKATRTSSRCLATCTIADRIRQTIEYVAHDPDGSPELW